ncbi:hypothetical protein [Roseimaritima sediminicola]|uniref:hypothetical protein n=1 Tax=Roseimaritima sediminicola TaxID=2662066 RepID=UPI0012983C70|nr:hypothetical protein [Roseimaritima sediminicola]
MSSVPRPRLSRTRIALTMLGVSSLLGLAFLAGRYGLPAATPTIDFPALPLDATASATGDSFSVATGSVGKSSEGFFMLDHDTGLLQCHVLYPRMGRFGASFAANVKEVLPGGGKGGGYLMVTGFADFPGASNQPISSGAVVYVLDSSTGAYACYAVPFDRVAETAGRPQQNALVLIGKGEARQVIERDTLR